MDQSVRVSALRERPRRAGASPDATWVRADVRACPSPGPSTWRSASERSGTSCPPNGPRCSPACTARCGQAGFSLSRSARGSPSPHAGTGHCWSSTWPCGSAMPCGGCQRPAGSGRSRWCRPAGSRPPRCPGLSGVGGPPGLSRPVAVRRTREHPGRFPGVRPARSPARDGPRRGGWPHGQVHGCAVKPRIVQIIRILLPNEPWCQHPGTRAAGRTSPELRSCE